MRSSTFQVNIQFPFKFQVIIAKMQLILIPVTDYVNKSALADACGNSLTAHGDKKCTKDKKCSGPF